MATLYYVQTAGAKPPAIPRPGARTPVGAPAAVRPTIPAPASGMPVTTGRSSFFV